MWIETLLSIEAAMGLCLSSLNVGLLAGVLRNAPSRGRRVAVLALVSVCSGQALEALLFLVQEGPSSGNNAWTSAALVFVRFLLAGSAALISILVARAAARR